jgi:hypothetical protein
MVQLFRCVPHVPDERLDGSNGVYELYRQRGNSHTAGDTGENLRLEMDESATAIADGRKNERRTKSVVCKEKTSDVYSGVCGSASRAPTAQG